MLFFNKKKEESKCDSNNHLFDLSIIPKVITIFENGNYVNKDTKELKAICKKMSLCNDCY